MLQDAVATHVIGNLKHERWTYEDEKPISQIPPKSLVLLHSVSVNWTDISRLHSLCFIQPTSQKLSERQINISQRTWSTSRDENFWPLMQKARQKINWRNWIKWLEDHWWKDFIEKSQTAAKKIWKYTQGCLQHYLNSLGYRCSKVR